MELSRRGFLKVSLGSGGALLCSLNFPVRSADNNTSFQANIYLRFNADGTIVYRDTKPEMGQGISTGLAMVVCDELGADWSQFIIERPPLTAFTAIEHSLESSAGSNGMLTAYLPLRQAAANLRQLFVESASQYWQCAQSECKVSNSKVMRRGTDEFLPFIELYDSVIKRNVPANAPLKNNVDLKLIGNPLAIIENKDIAAGKQKFSIDIQLDNMVHASIERSPTTDSDLLSVDDSQCRQLNGVIATIKMPAFPFKTSAENKWQEKYRGTKSGVAVIAQTTWHAMEGRKRLKLSWSKSKYEGHDDLRIKKDMQDISLDNIRDIVSHGEVQNEISKAPSNKIFTSQYYNPYQENAHIEPLNAVANYDGKKLTLWAGSQSPTLAIDYVAECTGISKKNIVIHSMRSGGGFGRRYFYDFVVEAAYLAVKLQRPVKVTWSRQDCIKHGRYHLARIDEHTIMLDEDSNPVAWDSLTRSGNNYGWLARNNMLDYYAGNTTHRSSRHAEGDSLVLLPGSWRSVDAHPQGLARECFIDEVAAKLEVDPIALRKQWLSQKAVFTKEKGLNESSFNNRVKVRDQLRFVLEQAEKITNWQKELSPNQGKGISLSYFYGTFVCQIAFVSSREDKVQIDEIVCVFDCGKVINPQLVKSQIEGSIIWSLSALKNPAIQVLDGKVVQSNFHDYPVLRTNDVPNIQIHLMESERAPNRVGESAVPDTAPAVLNAIFNLNGKRYKELPCPVLA
ncbi:xanthine dehydrogenase family protein molybdopterin-binding subunit [Thalassotalea marina]|uniref:Aldehyde dehydrogenase n=1 Tax=Thalassotalea marina TaxID=1673741 RepID=A0A919EL19_9GAMM|nr:molybdopterin cofactor-binding domain-containing protein [Thalassotalea marina]GHF97474.1 aldehyde dehydrogenase [Thalassotalea marina]